MPLDKQWTAQTIYDMANNETLVDSVVPFDSHVHRHFGIATKNLIDRALQKYNNNLDRIRHPENHPGEPLSHMKASSFLDPSSKDRIIEETLIFNADEISEWLNSDEMMSWRWRHQGELDAPEHPPIKHVFCDLSPEVYGEASDFDACGRGVMVLSAIPPECKDITWPVRAKGRRMPPVISITSYVADLTIAPLPQGGFFVADLYPAMDFAHMDNVNLDYKDLTVALQDTWTYKHATPDKQRSLIAACVPPINPKTKSRPDPTFRPDKETKIDTKDIPFT